MPMASSALPLSRPASAPSRLPWPATLAAVTAIAALLVTSGSFTGGNALTLIALLAALLGLRLTPWRLPTPSWAHWAVRAPLYALLIYFNWDKLNDPSTWLFDVSSVSAFGMLAAAELVVQAARTVEPGERGGAAVFLLSGFVFLAACTTDQVTVIRVASPLYFGFAALSAAGFEGGMSRREGRASRTRRGLATLAALALGALVYLAFWTFRTPLMQMGAGALRGHEGAESTGVSSQPTLGPTFGLRGSLQRVLRLQGPGGETYLRGASYDTYAQGRWGPPVNARHFRPWGERGMRGGASGASLQVTTLAPVRGMLFVPLSATGLRVSAEEAGQAQRDAGGAAFRVNVPVPAPYELTFGGRGAASLVGNALTPDARAADLAVPPEIDPRVRALAQQITQGATTPAAKAAAVQAFLFQNFRYSLTTDPGHGDPVSGFILGRKAAHCEFFASAAVILMRCAGVPARYITGYYAHESAGAGVTVVRQQDAHAWAEAWVSPSGWATVDATPADGRPPATAEPVPATRRVMEWVSDRIAALRAWLGQFTTGQILGALAAVVALYIGGRALWRRWRGGASGDKGFAYAHASEMDALARRFDAWLARIGAPCPPQTPWAEHVREHGLTEAQAFVAHYNTARFGPPPAADGLASLRVELAVLERDAAAARPRAEAAA